MFKSDLLPMKLFKFSSLFPQSLLTSTSLFLSSLRRITYACCIIFPSGKPVKLEEDNICLLYNFPFRQTCRYVLTSLATVKLALVSIDKFFAIVLMSLTTKITRSFSILESLKRDRKTTPMVLLRNVIH